MKEVKKRKLTIYTIQLAPRSKKSAFAHAQHGSRFICLINKTNNLEARSSAERNGDTHKLSGFRSLRTRSHAKRAAELAIKLFGDRVDRDEERIAHASAKLENLAQRGQNALKSAKKFARVVS